MTGSETKTGMSWGIVGKSLMPRTIGGECYRLTDWRGYELTKAIAVSLGESAGTLGAWHDNLDDSGHVSSRDCGLYQINIPASLIGTSYEEDLRTESLEEEIYQPVLENNIAAALAKYNAPWTRDGKSSKRYWQPWVAYTSGWATFPHAWTWKQTAGEPTGPWQATGRYIYRAIAGQMNMHVVIQKDWTVESALFYGKRYAAHFGITDAQLFIMKTDIVGWHYPPAPSSPPADGIGPRPVPNNGI